VARTWVLSWVCFLLQPGREQQHHPRTILFLGRREAVSLPAALEAFRGDGRDLADGPVLRGFIREPGDQI